MKSFQFARSAKAVRQTRRASLNLMPDWAEVKLEKRALLAVVTWDGGAGTMNWGDAANWDGDSLPGGNDDVLIPDLAGIQTIILNTSPTVLSVNSAEGLTVNSGQWLTVNGGSSTQVDGLFTLQGVLVASNANTTFQASNSANIQNAAVFSQYGASVTLGGMSQAYNVNFHANYGGTMTLPDLTTSNYIYFGANWDGDGSGRSSVLNVPKLQSSGSSTQYRALDGGTINSPSLINLDSTYVWIRGANSTMDLQGVTSLNNTQITLDSQNLISSLPLTSITNSSNIYSEGTNNLSLPSLTALSYSGLFARYGGVITASALTDVNTGYFGANWDGDGYGRSSVLNLPQLQNAGGNTQYRALDGGEINIPNLNNLESDYVWIRGANSTMDLQGVTSLNNTQITLDSQNLISSLPLTSITNSSNIYSEGTNNLSLPSLTALSYSGLFARYGGVISASGLTDVTNGFFGANWDGDGYARSSVLNLPLLQNAGGSTQYRALDGGVISSPKLNNLDNDNVYIRGANSTMDLSNVTSLNSSCVSLESANAITSLSISNMTGSTLFLQSSPVTTLPLNVMQGSTIYSWYTTNVTLPSLTTASDSVLRADYGGTLTLPVLTNMTNGGFGANWDGDYWYQRASVLNLPELEKTTGSTEYWVEDGGVISSPKLNNLDNDDVYIRGANSTMDLSNVTSLNSSYVSLESANAITSLSISNMTGSTLFLQSSPVTTLPLNVMQGSTILSSYTTNLTLPSLIAASDSVLRADYGGTLTLPVLTNMTNGGFGANWDGDYWYQRASVLNLPELEKTTGSTEYWVEDGGVISSPKLNNLDNDDVYIGGANSTMDLSNVTSLNSSYVSLESANAITSLSISNMTGSTLFLQSSPVKTLPLNVMQGSTIYSSYTTNVTLPSLTTASDSVFRAEYGGTLTLSVLINMTNGDFGANWDGDYWYQRASVLNLPELQKTTGNTHYRVQDGGTISSPKLNNLNNDDVYIRGANSTMDLSNVTSLNSSYVSLESANAITSLSISNMTGSTLYLRSSPVTTLPLNVMQGSTIYSLYTTNVTLPSLTTASDSVFRAEYGGTLTLSVLINMTNGSFGANWNGDGSQRRSVLNLPVLTQTTGGTTYRASDSGVINIPNLSNLDNDNLWIRGANASISLSNVTTLNSASLNFESANGIGSLPLTSVSSSSIYTSYSSNITFPALTTAVSSGFYAYGGSVMSFSTLANVTNGSFGANWDGDGSKRGSIINLSSLQTACNTSIRAYDSGIVRFGQLNVVLAGTSGSIGIRNNGTVVGNLTLRNGFTVNGSGSGSSSNYTITGSVINDGGKVYPGGRGGVGQLHITGNYNQTSDGLLEVDINGANAGSRYDQLLVGGTAQLAGILHVNQNYNAAANTTFKVFDAAAVVNDFQIMTVYNPSNLFLNKVSSSTGVNVNVSSPPVISVSDKVQNEGDINWGSIIAFVVRGVAPTGGLIVNYTTTGGNPGLDYVSKTGNFTVPAGIYSQTINVTIIGNQMIQNNRQLQFQASANGVSTVTGSGMIYDDDAPASVSFNTSMLVASPNTGFNPSPTLTVRNLYGNYVQGASVSLLVGSSIAGASADFSNGTNSLAVTTDSNGTANVPALTANAKFGSYRLTANALALNGSATATGNMTLVNTGNTGLSWDGGAATNNWDDELNWNEDRLPMSFDDVVVGDLPGSQTIVINTSPVIKSLQSAESIRLAASQTLQLTAGNSSINGSLVLPNGSSLSANGSASLVVGGGSELTSGCLTATSGASIVINGVSTAINPRFYASGSNSTISVNGLESIQSNYYLTYSYPRVEAQYGGAIYLPNLTTSLRAGTYIQGQISVYGVQSLVSMPKLNQFDGFECISVSGGANFTLPMVTTAKNLYLYSSDTGSQISLPNLTTIYSNSIVGGRGRTDINVYSNAVISLPCLTTIALQDPGVYAGTITINYQGSRLIAPNLRYISAISTINAYSDVTFETSGNLSNNGNLTIYSSGNLSVGNLHFSNTNVVMSSSPRFSGNLFLDSGANISGAASVYGNLTVASGALRLSSDSPEVFNVYGNYTQGSAGTLEVRIGGCNTTTYNQLVVSGTANISGSLTGGFTGTEVPTVGKTYEIIKAGSVQNDFSGVSLDQYGWIGLTKTSTSNSVMLTTITSNTPPSLWTMNSPAGGTLPAGVTLVGGLVLDMVGVNGVRVVSQLSANSLYIGFYDNGTPTSYRGNPGTIGIQAGITANAVNALGGGLTQVAVRMTLWDGDTGLEDFDRNVNTFYLNGVLMENYSNVTTQQTSTNGLIVYSNNTNGGFRDETLDTGFFFSKSTSFLTDFFNTLSTGNVTFTSHDTDPYDNYYDYTQGIAGGLINVGMDPNVSPSSILLSSNSIAEIQPVGTLIGTLSAVDANAGDTHTFALVNGTGSDDNGSFTIIGNKLYSNTVFDYESKNSLSIRIRVTDNGGLSYDQALAIVVTNVNESPTNVTAGGPYSIYQGQSLTLTANATDPDANSTLSYSWDINNDGTFGDAIGQTPTVTWSQINALGITAVGLRNIKVRVSDGIGGSTDSPLGNLSINQTVLHYVSGNQSTSLDSLFADPLKVSATDSIGNSVVNVVITFNAPNSGASVSFTGGATTATTGSDGVATSSQLTANSVSGTYQVTASVEGVSPSASFNLTNVNPVPSSLQIVSAYSQSAGVGSQFLQTMKVKALDSSGVAMSGVTIVFAAPASGASGSFAGGINSVVTSADGVAESPLFTAGAIWGSYQVAASVTGVAPVMFVMTNTPFAGAIVVNSTSDTDVAGYTDLRQAVAFANAQAGDNTVLFDPTLFATSQTIVLSGVIAIKDTTGTTTIQGPDNGSVTISGNNSTGLFLVKAPTTMTNLTLTNATGAGTLGGASSGGAILNISCLTLDHISIYNSSVNNGYGGAIASSYGGYDYPNDITANVSLVATNLVISNTTSGPNWGFGGAIYSGAHNSGTSTNLILINSCISNTYARLGGGAINHQTGYFGGTANLLISNATLANTSSGMMAGGILIGASSASNVTIDKLKADKSSSGSGGLLQADVDLSAANMTFITVSNSTISNTSATNGGVFLFNRGKNIVVRDTSFTNTTATGNGGLIQIDSGNALSPAVLNISNISVNNTTASYGGGIYAANSVVSIDKMNLTNAYATNYGGGIYSAASTLEANNITISDSLSNNGAGIYFTTGNLKLANAIIQRNHSTTSGGGLYLSSGNVTITGSVFQDNVSASNGGGIYIADTSQINISSSDFSRNTSSMGGAIDNGSTYSTIDISNSTFSNNTVTIHGGAIGNGIGNLTIANSTFTLNSAPSGGAIMNFTNLVLSGSTLSNNNATYGGGIYAYYGTTTLVNSTIQNNNASNQGGGIYANNGTTTLANSTIQNNNATYGGGIYQAFGSIFISSSDIINSKAVDGAAIYGSNLDININSSSISNNNATGIGVAILRYSNLTMSNSTFINNTATKNASLSISSSRALIDYSSFIDNTVRNGTFSNAGAIRGSGKSNITINNSSFKRNSSGNAGAVMNYCSNMSINNSIFEDNNGVCGGALASMAQPSSPSYIYINQSIFTRNYATTQGGAISTDGYMELRNSVLNENSAFFWGGAIYTSSWDIYPEYPVDSSGISIISNTLLSNNKVTGNLPISNNKFGGGAIDNYGGSPILINCSIVGNDSGVYPGGGINEEYPGNITLINTIVANNVSGTSATDINSNLTANSVNNLIGDGTGAIGVSNGVNHNIIGNATSRINPLLASLSNYDGSTPTMPPLPGSPAIGAGTTGANVPATDQRGFARGGLVDIGSVQTQGFTVSNITGSGQSATVNSNFTNPLGFKVTAVNEIDPIAGGVVAFNTPVTGASGLIISGSNQATIDANGFVSSGIFKANTVAGNYQFTSSANGLTPVQFLLTNLAGAAAAMNVVSGSGQSAKLGVTFANPLIVSVVDTYGNAVAGTTVTFAVPGSGASATFAGGVNTAVSGADGLAASAALSANNVAGSYVVTASAPGLSDKSFALNNTVFTVTGLEVVDGSSLRVRFNDTIATSGLQINDVYTGNVVTEEADLIVKDSNGTVVRGSMIVASDLKSLLFVKTGASFSPGAYSVKLRSGTTSFRGSDGKLLDGNGDGTYGGDYISSINAIATDRTLSIPDVVRGPGQDLRVNTTDNGIPVKISDGQNIFTFEMSINYDPNLVNVSELVVATALTGNLEISYKITVPGRIDIVGISPTGLPTGAQTLFYVRGSVPSGALYRTKCNIGVSDLKLYKLDGTSFSSTVDSGLMLNSYVGDVTGDGRYNSLDSLRIQRYLVNLDRWFTQYPLMDPSVIADVNRDAKVNALDSLFMQRYLVNMVVPFITAPPVSSVTQTPGLDPIIRLPKGLTAKRSQVVQVPIEIVNTDSQAIHVNSFEVAIAMDPKTFRMLKVNSKAQITQRYDARRGVLVIGGILPGLKLEPGEGHILATLSLKVAANAIATDFALNLLDEAKFGRERYLTSVNSGDLVLLPAPTSGSNDSVDGKIRIMDGPNRKVSGGGVEAFSVLKYRKNRFIGR